MTLPIHGSLGGRSGPGRRQPALYGHASPGKGTPADSDRWSVVHGSGMAETYRVTGVREAASESGFVSHISCFCGATWWHSKKGGQSPPYGWSANVWHLENRKSCSVPSSPGTRWAVPTLRSCGPCPPYDRRAIEGHPSPTLAVARMGHPARNPGPTAGPARGPPVGERGR